MEIIVGFAEKGGSLERNRPGNLVKLAVQDLNKKANGRTLSGLTVHEHDTGISVLAIAEGKIQGGKK